MIWYQLRSGVEPEGLRGAIAPRSLKKNPLSRYIMKYSFFLYFNQKKKKKLPLSLWHQESRKKNFSHIPNHITFSPNILFLLVLSHHPFYCSFFSKEIVFSLIFTTLFLWNNDMNTINFTNWRFINHFF